MLNGDEHNESITEALNRPFLSNGLNKHPHRHLVTMLGNTSLRAGSWRYISSCFSAGYCWPCVCHWGYKHPFRYSTHRNCVQTNAEITHTQTHTHVRTHTNTDTHSDNSESVSKNRNTAFFQKSYFHKDKYSSLTCILSNALHMKAHV